MEKKYTSIITFGVIIAALFAILVFARLRRTPLAPPDTYNEVSPSAELALDFNAHRHYVFTRDDCIHCQNLENYLDNHEGSRAALDLETANLSVTTTSSYFYDKAVEFTQLCGQDPAGLGTPFLYINDENVPLSERCISGDTPIMEYFDAQLVSTDTASSVTSDLASTIPDLDAGAGAGLQDTLDVTSPESAL